MNFVFLMDPLHTVKIKKDTTFILMWGAHQRGHKCFYLPKDGLTLENAKLRFSVNEVVPQKNEENPFIVKKQICLKESDVDCLFIRSDPPFDSKYLMHTWLLDQFAKRTFTINSPNGIRTVNEKLWATQFTRLVPPTIVSSRKDILKDFINKHRIVIAKPANNHGGQGVFQVRTRDINRNVILESLTKQWTKEIILQKYIAKAASGDKRIILLNGEPLGAVLRVHPSDDHRNNFFAGGKPFKTKITPRDLQIINELKPHLRALGLYFVGIDIIGDYLIEVNVTSPTCLQEINQLGKVALEAEVIKFVERMIKDQNKS